MKDDDALQVPEEHGTANAYRRIIRTRRALTATLALLVILLLIAFLALLSIYKPVGEPAKGEEAGGVEWVRSIYGWGNERTQQLGAPQNVAVAPDGTVWVTDAGMSRIIGFNPDGTYKTLLHQGPRGSSENALSFPASVAVDEDGLVYVGDMTASEVVVITPDNEVVQRISVPRPRSVAVRGDMLVVGSTPGFGIFTKAGELLTLVGERGSGDFQFDGVAGVAIGDDGTIYVVDQYNNRVSAYEPDGTRVWMVSTGNPNTGLDLEDTMKSRETTAEAALQLPSAITIDGVGRLVIVDAFGFEFAILDSADGKLIAKYGKPGVKDGQFVYPSGISYDHNRDYFAVADTSMSRVQLIRLPGSGGTLMATMNRALMGPLRVCLLPLALLLLTIVIWRIYARRKTRRELLAEEQLVPAED